MKDDLIERLRELLGHATPGPWQLQDGCSWRRIGTPFSDGAVLCPDTYSREDRHPDLTAKDGRLYDNLRLIVEGINSLPELLADQERQAAEIERLREALAWCHEQASDAMLVSAGAATANGDPDGALEMLNRIASDIAANAEAALAVRTLLTKEQ